MKDLRIRLLELHRTLLDAVRREYEREHGRLTPAEFLQRLISDEELAWLRPFTSSISRLDEQLDAGKAAPMTSDLSPLCELRELLDPDQDDDPFQVHYREWIDASPEVAYAHCATLQLLAA